MRTLTHEEAIKLGMSHPIIHKRDGKNTYFVGIDAFYRGTLVRKTLNIVFGNSRADANSFISWLTDGNMEDMSKSYLEHMKLSAPELDLNEFMKFIKICGTILVEKKDVNYEAFIKASDQCGIEKVSLPE